MSLRCHKTLFLIRHWNKILPVSEYLQVKIHGSYEESIPEEATSEQIDWKGRVQPCYTKMILSNLQYTDKIRVSLHVVSVNRFYDGPRSVFTQVLPDNRAISIQW